jgi:hypothetical protein
MKLEYVSRITRRSNPEAGFSLIGGPLGLVRYFVLDLIIKGVIGGIWKKGGYVGKGAIIAGALYGGNALLSGDSSARNKIAKKVHEGVDRVLKVSTKCEAGLAVVKEAKKWEIPTSNYEYYSNFRPRLTRKIIDTGALTKTETDLLLGFSRDHSEDDTQNKVKVLLEDFERAIRRENKE